MPVEIIVSSSFPYLSDGEREAFRAAAANLALALPDGSITAVTSCRDGAKKTEATLALAAALAGAGHRVIVIDGDLRSGALSTLLGATKEIGLSEVLMGGSENDLPLLTTDVPGLSFLPSGKRLSDPRALLSSARLKRTLQALAEISDFVLVDTPPILPTADGSLIAAASETVLLYVTKKRVSRRNLIAAKLQLEKSGNPIVGTLVGAVPAGRWERSFLFCFPFFWKKSSRKGNKENK